MRLAGAIAVAREELRRRIRAGRWRWLLVAWFVVLAGFTALLRSAAHGSQAAHAGQLGTVMYGGLQLFLLGLALLVVPALTSQSVNGDRERGVLATLQVTRLSPFELAAGKLLSAWGVATVFLALSAPLVAWCMAEGGVPLVRVVAVSLVMVLLLGVVCAIALGLSSLLARSTTSSVLSYVAVFALTIGTLIAFGLATAATTSTTSSGTSASTDSHTERTWWLLAPNPFVVLADAAPVAPRHRRCETQTIPTPEGGTNSFTTCTDDSGVDPLGSIGRGVRALRTSGGLVWPYGLGADVLLGAGMLVVTTRRLRTPSRRLPTGVRVA